jgi:hypothetical protein
MQGQPLLLWHCEPVEVDHPWRWIIGSLAAYRHLANALCEWPQFLVDRILRLVPTQSDSSKRNKVYSFQGKEGVEEAFLF